MLFENEDGLTFSCKPLIKCNFNIDENTCIYVAVVNMNNEDYALFNSNDCLNCIRGVRNFVSKYKIPAKVYSVKLNESTNDKYSFVEQYSYSYESYLKYLERRKNEQF